MDLINSDDLIEPETKISYKELWLGERRQREEMEALFKNQGAFLKAVKTQMIGYRDSMKIFEARVKELEAEIEKMKINQEFLRAQVPKSSMDIPKEDLN